MDDLKPTRVVEANRGYLWLATPKGIIRYNGYEAILYKTETEVTAVFEDSNKQIWGGTKTGQILQLVDNQLIKYKTQDNLPTTPIIGIVEDAAHQMWFATYGEGVFHIEKNHLNQLTANEGLLGNDIYCIATAPNGDIWLGTDEGISICHSGKNTVSKLTKAEGLPDAIVRSLAFDTHEKAWIGLFDMGVCTYDMRTKTFLHNTPKWQNGVVDALSIKGETVWIGTENQGIFTYEPATNSAVSQNFQKDKIYAIHHDNEDNTWILSQKGGLQVTNGRFNIQNTGVSNIQTVLYARGETIYLGTKEGLFSRKKGYANFEKMLPEKFNILSLFEDYGGNIWIGTYGTGLYCLKKNGVLAHFTEKDGLSNGSIFSIDSKNDTLWLATLGGVTACNLAQFYAGQKDFFTIFNTSKGLSTDFIYKIFIDSKNRVWFGTDGNGVSCLDAGRITNYKEAQGQALEAVYSITEDGIGQIWIATSKNKLFFFDKNIWKEYPLPTAHTNRRILGLATDRLGNIVMSCMGGISVLNPVTHHFLNFDKELTINRFEPSLNAFSKTPQGSILFASQSELIQYNAMSQTIASKPRLILRGISIFMQPIDFQKNNQFAYNQNYLSFSYEGFWFSQPDKVRYRYKLEGLDPDWQYTKERTVTYANLPNGTFTMHIQAALNDSFDQYAEVKYPFTIQQAFWKSWWFILLSLALLGFLTYLFIKNREKRLEREATLKREKVEAQLDMLKSQINPHFLFNSFNTLIATIEDSPDKAIEYTEKLSNYFRSILQVRDKPVISVQEELNLLDNFIFLLKKRHANNITFDINLRTKSNFIVPMTLQMLVENAVKHNIVSRNRPLSISITESTEGYIEVRNNLQRKTDVEQSTHFGLHSIKSQYANLTTQPISVEELDGFFTVFIPILKNDT